MFRPLSLSIGLRYTRASKRHSGGFISFISLVSMLGIALGVMVLLTVLSVMNGFDYEIKHHIFAMARHVTVTSSRGALSHWPRLDKQIQQYSAVKASAPFLDGQAMLASEGLVQAVMVTGILPEREKAVSAIAEHMVKGEFNQLKPRHFGVVLGDELARSLGLSLGDDVMVITPEATASPVGVLPRFKRFKVVGLFHVENGFGYNSQVALVHLKDAQTLLGFGQAISGLRLRVSNLYGAAGLAQQLAGELKGHYRIADWTQQYGEFFRAIRMQKTMMFLILLLIIAVAAFNLVSSLVMVVTDKQSDIAILRTMGMSPWGVLRVFVVQGGLIGLLGSALGIAGGIALSLHVTQLVNLIERWFDVQFLSSSVYYVDFLPSRLLWSDVWHVGLLALCLSLLATWYPAWKAAGVRPAEALRYE